MNAPDKIKMVILAAKLAHEALALITINSADVARLQFQQIVTDLKALDEHLKKPL